jgi:dihydroflavonol-4-reductase
MTSSNTFSPIHAALVTGATGLLGNNLVRLLVSRGVHVKAMVRSREKAEKQLAGPPIEIVVDEMTNVSGFASELKGVDVIFRAAAYFRDNYKGGKHWKQLFATNVLGTAHLFAEAYKAGVRRIVHTSSVAVLSGAPGKTIDDTMRRNPEDADDYYRSKILADRKVDAFLETHADMWACMVLLGWMVEPGDVGPTSSGQVILDFLHRRLPGIPPATFSGVDARDVAEAMWLAERRKEGAVNATLPRDGTCRWGICFRSWSRSPKFLRRDGLCPCRCCTPWQPRMKSGLALPNGQRWLALRAFD